MSLELFDPWKGITISISLFLINAKYLEICSTAIDDTDNIKLMIGIHSLNALMIPTQLNYKKTDHAVTVLYHNGK
jgi:hypothetical protein